MALMLPIKTDSAALETRYQERIADHAPFAGDVSALFDGEDIDALLDELMDACDANIFRIQSSLRISGNDEDHSNHSQDSLAHAPYSMMTGDLKDRMPEFIRAINFQILQLARPESVFNLRGRLPREYIEEYFRQEHFSFVNIVRHVMLLPWNGNNSSFRGRTFQLHLLFAGLIFRKFVFLNSIKSGHEYFCFCRF